jgi:phosphoribosylanthranilate isomerase
VGRVRVKICGITCLEDARHAIDCGADALGFVFYRSSPRCVTVAQARQIIEALPPFVSMVGLFVNEAPLKIAQIAQQCHLDLVQLHGDESPADCRLEGRRVIKALRVRDATSLAQAADYPVAALLLDAWVAGHYGGTGATFNWQLAAAQARRGPVILAGGLTPENVAAAVQTVAPFAVDVSSGVESAPGRKDPARVAAFIRNAKAALPEN